MKKLLQELFIKKEREEAREEAQQLSETVRQEFLQLKEMGLSIAVFAK